MFILEKFNESLENKIRCTDNFDDGVFFRTKQKAINYKYISVNQNYKSQIIIDIDKPSSAFLWEKENLPPPSLIIINKINTHSHYIYQLNTPVIYTENGRPKPQKFYEAVDSALTNKLNGDLGYSGLITKNPNHKEWGLIEHNRTYDLSEFQEYLDIPAKGRRTSYRPLLEDGGRNTTIFNEVRLWAYVEVKNHISYETFRDCVSTKCHIRNIHFIPNLPSKEVNTIANSISKWVWKHRNSIGNRNINKGIMGLEDLSIDLNIKQSLAADYTNNVKKMKLIDKFSDVINKTKALGEPLERKYLIKNGIAERTFTRNSALIFDLLKFF
jgi:hypothetical protein